MSLYLKYQNYDGGKMKINYICEWEKDKTLTWSGTTYSLYKALGKRCFINDYDIALNWFEKKLAKLFQIRLIGNKIETNKISSKLEKKLHENKTKKMNLQTEEYTLQIGDYLVVNENSYVYQDLSIDSLIYYKSKNINLFQYSGFQYATDKDLEKRRAMQYEVYKNSKGIFTMSKWLRDNLINYTGIEENKVHHVGAGINIDVKQIKHLPKNNNKILFIGRDFYRKGGDLVYNAFNILKQEYNKDAELYIIGPKEWPLENKAEGVEFLGDISYDELIYYFNKCDIFCMPSRFEAYGLVFIEALVYGLPCIARNEFAMKEFIKDGYNGYLIDEDNENELAIKMNNLLNNSEIKQNVLDKREEYIKEYSWDTVANRIISIMKKSK